MKICILMGSPRKKGNTATLTDYFCAEASKKGHECRTLWLYDKRIEGCRACRHCQRDHTVFGCAIRDDMQEVFDEVLACDLLILATPIYSWYCTPPMKAALDRLVYGMNKFYGDVKGPALWAGKYVALISTCGYPPEKGADLWESGMKRYCRHSQLIYLGMWTERHLGYHTAFDDSEKASHARLFAEDVLKKIEICPGS